MSAFMCTDEHIATIAANLKQSRYCGHQTRYRDSAETAIDAQAMFALNAEAVALRYREERQATPDLEYWKALIESLPVCELSPVEFAKAIDCFTYQCSESELIVNSALFKQLRAASHAALIVAVQDQYTAAKWGF